MSQLMKAVNSKNSGQVKGLIQEGVNVSELDSNGDAPLVIAAYKGYTEILELLLEAGADVSAVDPGMKATALHAAAYAGRTESVKLLLKYHIDIDKQGPFNGYTALHDAVWQNNVETARVLIEGGANLQIKSNSGETPLDFARSKGHKEIVALLEKKMAGR